MAAGADDFVTKPVEIDRLKLSLQQLMKIHHMAQAIARFECMPMLLDMEGNLKKLKSIEEEAIRFALQYSDGCMTRAARNLGIGRSTLYRRIHELEGHISRANQATRPMMNVSSSERS
jgi:DNA-binding NtrC family response regulator